MGDALYKDPYKKIFGSIFNYWIGLFYGVCPSSFIYGHSINHHKYDNRENDVVSTSDRPRDSFLNFVRYSPRFGLYAINISTVIQFYKEGKYSICFKMTCGTLYWLSFVSLIYNFTDKWFTFFYVVYPYFEQYELLSAINWAWHAFIDPEEPENQYINSVTILDGVFNVLNEDYHVVHHQYPGVHWTKNADLYEKHKEEYYKGTRQGTVFAGTQCFEMFVLIAFAKYDDMARKMLTQQHLTHEERVEFLKKRLRTCTWGPFKTVNQKTTRFSD